MSEYWWDRSGDDPELERVERLLSALTSQRHAPPERPRLLVTRWRVAAALALSAAAVLAFGLWRRHSGSAWEVYAIAGTPTLQNAPISGVGRWSTDQVLETGPGARAKILIDRIGEVDVEPGSRLRLLPTRGREHRLALDSGTLRAFIWAPPRRFFVETPEAVAVDLGCAYSLQVETSGAGWLRVAFGWVSFFSPTTDREVYVPAGAACILLPGRGAGTPHFEDASKRFLTAVGRLDASTEDREAVSILLAEARRKDALTLLQLLPHLALPERTRIFDGLAGLVPPPAGVERDAILRGDQRALGRYWEVFGLGELKWWRLGRDLPGPPNRP